MFLIYGVAIDREAISRLGLQQSTELLELMASAPDQEDHCL